MVSHFFLFVGWGERNLTWLRIRNHKTDEGTKQNMDIQKVAQNQQSDNPFQQHKTKQTSTPSTAALNDNQKHSLSVKCRIRAGKFQETEAKFNPMPMGACLKSQVVTWQNWQELRDVAR